jgi:hypothetical protein
MLPHLSETPAIEVYLVQSFEPPGGTGEARISAGVPAVTNAIFAANLCTKRTAKNLTNFSFSMAAPRDVLQSSVLPVAHRLLWGHFPKIGTR